MSLRARLLIAMVVLVTAGLVAADLATYRSLSSFLLRRVDAQLERFQLPAANALGHPGGPELPQGTLAELLDSSGRVVDSVYFRGIQAGPEPRLLLPADVSGSGSREEPRYFTAGAEGGTSDYRVVARPVSFRGGQGTLLVGVPLQDVSQTLDRLVIVELVVTAVVLLLMAGLALWLVRVGLRPLEGIGRTAGAIAAGDLTRRVEPAESRTEIGRLGLALNSMLAQIEAAFDERRASEARLRRFIADASHELRTPLTSIRGYAELFRRGAESRPEDLAKSMQRIEAEASRMGVLVDDLLLLARLDQGRPLEREPVDVARIVTEAVDSARAIEPERPIDLDVDGPASVVGDGGRLRQVVDNLLDNVRVHAGAETPVRVSVEAVPGEIVLSVADQGPGLPPEAAHRVFERFYRGDPARSRKTGGAGLGLSIVSAIVEAHGGRVTASAEASGATLEVHLPTGSKEQPGSSQERDAGLAVQVTDDANQEADT